MIFIQILTVFLMILKQGYLILNYLCLCQYFLPKYPIKYQNLPKC